LLAGFKPDTDLAFRDCDLQEGDKSVREPRSISTYLNVADTLVSLNMITTNCPSAELSWLNAYFKGLIAFAACVIDPRRPGVLYHSIDLRLQVLSVESNLDKSINSSRFTGSYAVISDVLSNSALR